MFFTVIIVIFLIIFFIVTLPFAIIASFMRIFNKQLSERFFSVFIRFAARGVLLLGGVHVDVKGAENIPDCPVLYIGNHTGIFDIVIMLAVTHRSLGCLAKVELGKIPVLNWWMVLIGCTFLDRKDPRQGIKAIQKSAETYKRGTSLLIFPEGTRHNDGTVHEFKTGSLKIATKCGAKIVPFGIQSTSEIFEDHIPAVKPSRIIINFGEVIDVGNMSKQDQKVLGQTTREAVSGLIVRN